MALGAIEAGVSSAEGEEIVLDVGPEPTGRYMASLTIRNPVVRRMIRAGRPGQYRGVTTFALGGGPTELPGLGPGVTAFAGGHGMDTNEGKARTRMFGNQSDGIPGLLIVTALTFQSQCGGMRVGMTATATAGQVGLYRSSIVMAS